MKIKADKMCKLEKFGFTEYKNDYRQISLKTPSDKDLDLYEDFYGTGKVIFIDKETREIKVFIGLCDCLSRDVKHYIQDLIKADMVEA